MKCQNFITKSMAIMAIFFILAGYYQTGYSQSTTVVTIELVDSYGNPIDGAKVMYKGGPISPGTWFLFGYTGNDGSGTGSVSRELVSGYDYFFRVEYNMTHDVKSEFIGSSPMKLRFQTSKITVELKSSEGVGISGAKVKYRGSISSGTWFLFGWTGSDGKVSKELFPGNWWFRVEYNQGYSVKQQFVNNGSIVSFHTTKVTILNKGIIKYKGRISTGTWFTYHKPFMDMMPGTYTFNINGAIIQIDINGKNLIGGILTLLDHNGNGLAGGKAKWADGSWHSIPGQTDENGRLWFTVSNPNFVKIAMTYNQGTVQQYRNDLESTNYTWRTALLRIELRNHSNELIKENPGGRVDQGGWFWQHHGYTGIRGFVDVELFPRKSPYKFKMTYNYISQIKYVTISEEMNTLTFQTGRLTLHFSGDIVYAAGAWRKFKKPSMELLPVKNLRVRFFGCVLKYNISSGDNIEKSIIVAYLQDHRKRGLKGGYTSYAIGGKWLGSLGTTGTNGKVCKDFDGKLEYVKVRMTYNQASVEKVQYQPTNSIYIFKTVRATIKVINHIAQGIPGVPISQGGRYWQYHGTTNSKGELYLELFPGKNYKFKASLNGSYEIKWFYVPGAIVFQTGLVKRDNVYTGSVKASIGGSWRYYWPSPGSSAELFPGIYKFVYTPDPGQGTTEWVTVKVAQVTTIPFGGTSLPKQMLIENEQKIVSPIPKEYILKQNYPNPFNSETTIQFGIPENTHVTVEIYSITGKKVSTILDQKLTAGYHRVVWKGTNDYGYTMPSGVYICVIKMGNKQFSNRLILVR